MRRMPPWAAIVIAAFLFGAVHLDLHGLPIRTLLGILLGWLVVAQRLDLPGDAGARPVRHDALLGFVA